MQFANQRQAYEAFTLFFVNTPRHINTMEPITIDLASVVTGLSASAIRTNIARGIWVEKREYVRNHGRVYVDLKGFEKWVLQGV